MKIFHTFGLNSHTDVETRFYTYDSVGTTRTGGIPIKIIAVTRQFVVIF